uniref:Uncharacterized protein n=1 Tax=Setaria digitata TaxID=48799 RepID=A0A915PXX4_9BILA
MPADGMILGTGLAVFTAPVQLNGVIDASTLCHSAWLLFAAYLRCFVGACLLKMLSGQAHHREDSPLSDAQATRDEGIN